MIKIKYKLVCIDMDGTLLNSDHRISDNSKDIIKKAHMKGVHIVISTGRMFADAESYSELIGVRSPIIASNGAVIRGVNKNDIIYKSAISEKLCNNILNVFKEHDMKPCYITPQKVYIRGISQMFFFWLVKFKGIMTKDMKLQYVGSWKRMRDILSLEKDNIVKCEVINKNKDKIKKIRSALEEIKEIEIVGSSDYNIEITNKGVSKGKGIQVISAYFNINKDEIIAIGDSENDLSMMEYAGVGIAMGNAVDSVKKRAVYVTDSNDNDGVAKAIAKFIFGNSN